MRTRWEARSLRQPSLPLTTQREDFKGFKMARSVVYLGQLEALWPRQGIMTKELNEVDADSGSGVRGWGY